MKKILISGLLFLIANVSFGQFSLSGEIRPRTEYRHGYKALADSNQAHAVFTDQRTRLYFGYEAEGFKTKVTLQDVRTWGSQSQLVGNEDYGVSIHEAWGEALVSDEFSIRFGRQELVYDDHRIFGNVGWAQQARSHDGVVLKYEKEKFKLHAGGAYNQGSPSLSGTYYSVPGSYKALQYLWAHGGLSEAFGFSFLFLNNGKQAEWTDAYGNLHYHDNYSQTIGLRPEYKSGKLSANANLFYQMGKTPTVPANDINAYLLGAEVAYSATDQVKVILGHEMQSGNSQTDTTASYNEIQHAFTPFYGTNHKFNGHMDYFYVGNHVGSVGLQDSYLKVKYKAEKFNVGADFHMFRAAANVLDRETLAEQGTYTSMDPTLGYEVDAYLGFNLSEGVAFKAGYSHLIPTETMQALKGGEIDEVHNWAFAMITFKPQFITSKEK